MVSARKQLSSLKTTTECEPEFKSCDSSEGERLMHFGPEEGRDEEDIMSRSSGNSPFLTAGRLSFAPSILPAAPPPPPASGVRPLAPLTALSARHHPAQRFAHSEWPRKQTADDIVASIDLMVKDIMEVTTLDRQVPFHEPLSARHRIPPTTTRFPREYKRRSLTARGPSMNHPGLLLCQNALSRTNNFSARGPGSSCHWTSARRSSARSSSSSDDEDSGPEEVLGPPKLLVERRLSLNKSVDLPGSLAVLRSRDFESPTFDKENNSLARTSIDPIALIEHSPSPATTPFQSRIKSQPVSCSIDGPPHELNHELAASQKMITKKNREQLASHFYAYYNELVFDNQLPKNLTLEWNPRFVRVSGRTTFRRITPGLEPSTPRPLHEEDEAPLSKSYFRSDALGEKNPRDPSMYSPIRISLSSKLLTTTSRLKATLLHEMCHLGQKLLRPDVQDGAHGPSFMEWVEVARAKAPDVKINIQHEYSVDSQHFRWQCKTCNHTHVRLQNLIDCNTLVCNVCLGTLEFLGRFDKMGRAITNRGARRPAGGAMPETPVQTRVDNPATKPAPNEEPRISKGRRQQKCS